MVKSGGKLIGVGLPSLVVGCVIGHSSDGVKGMVGEWMIRVTVVLCIPGAAVFLYGLYTLIAGLATHK